MSTFTLAISCYHFQFTLIHGPDIPGSYTILLFTASDLGSITSHIHNWVLFLLWLHPFILSGVISPLISSSILGTYRVMASRTVLCAFPLVAFKIFSLSCDFSGFSGICLKCDYFAFILCRVNWASWIFDCYLSLVCFGMFSAIMSSLFFFFSCFILSSLFGILITYKIVLQVLVALFFFPVVFFFSNFYFILHNFCEPVFKFTGFIFPSALSIS